MLVPGYLRVGRLQVPVYGLFAAVGLVAAMGLSQRSAKLVGISGLDKDKLWDAGMVAVVAAFVASRVLLIAQDFRSFLQYPLLMLALPSLTYGGMALTAGFMWIYLRWEKLPLLDVLDAWAPCAALLAAVLSLGHFVEGTDAGMPTSLPWGVRTAGDHVLGKVHPVQLYAMVAALGMVEWLMIRLKRRGRSGEVAGLALLVGGVISFGLDMLRQPFETMGAAWLDPSQWVALGAIVVGGLIWCYRPTSPLSREEAASILENFARGPNGRGYDHEALEYYRWDDPLLLEVRDRFLNLQREFPPTEKGYYCNEEGMQVLLNYARQLRSSSSEDASAAKAAEF